MDPVTITTVITTSLLLVIELVKRLKKSKVHSSCCVVDSQPHEN